MVTVRSEKDSIGEAYIEDYYYYGIQTQRAINNFDISSIKCFDYPLLLNSLANIKKSAAESNYEIGILSERRYLAIKQACEEIISGNYSNQFPIDIFQGGGGTSLNMNMNEVIANRANEIITGNKGYDEVHPNNHVNLGQSTNDVIPSSMHIASYYYIENLLKELIVLRDTLASKVNEYKNIVKISRTCLQDAVPITFGQEFSGYESFVSRSIRKFNDIKKDCLYLNLGGTVSGTGLGAYPGYSNKIYKSLSRNLGINVKQDDNIFDSYQNSDFFSRLSSELKNLASFMSKMSSDLRLLSSGPRSGLSEIQLPSVQPGSSIMPGKINPVMPEMMIQASFQVFGNDLVISKAVERGELDLNIWEPIIIKNLFDSFDLMSNSINLFTKKCISKLKVNCEVCEDNAHSSLALSTVIASLYNYEIASSVAKEAYKYNKTIKEVVVEKELLSIEEAETYLNPLELSNLEKSSELLYQFENK